MKESDAERIARYHAEIAQKRQEEAKADEAYRRHRWKRWAAVLAWCGAAYHIKEGAAEAQRGVWSSCGDDILTLAMGVVALIAPVCYIYYSVDPGE